jgi:hypothetical protein
MQESQSYIPDKMLKENGESNIYTTNAVKKINPVMKKQIENEENAEKNDLDNELEASLNGTWIETAEQEQYLKNSMGTWIETAEQEQYLKNAMGTWSETWTEWIHEAAMGTWSETWTEWVHETVMWTWNETWIEWVHETVMWTWNETWNETW